MRKGILYIPLSYNADSMTNIINILFCNECCKKFKLPFVDKITFLSVKEEFTQIINYKGEDIVANDFCQKIKMILGEDCVEIRQRVISEYAKDIPKVIMDGVREVGRENIIIDLTCGKKDITGSLYTTASICQIKNMVYIQVPRIDKEFPSLDRNNYPDMENKFTLQRFESLDDIKNLASLNEMDFIYYKKSVQEILQAVNSPKIESYCTQINHIIEEYFSENPDNYRNAIREIGLINEELTNSIGARLYELFSDIGIKKYNEKRSLDTIREIEAKYQEKNLEKNDPDTYNALNEKLKESPALFEMLEMLRIYRNRASHYRDHEFSREDVRMLLDILLRIFDAMISVGLAADIWGENNNEDDNNGK